MVSSGASDIVVTFATFKKSNETTAFLSSSKRIMAPKYVPPFSSKLKVLSSVTYTLEPIFSCVMLSNSNKDLADSLYRLNALYSTSSQFSGTLDKAKLIQYMIEGMDRALSFSLTCTLSFCTTNEPVLLLNSLYELSYELIEALKVRTVLNYNSLFEGKKPPFEINEETACKC